MNDRPVIEDNCSDPDDSEWNIDLVVDGAQRRLTGVTAVLTANDQVYEVVPGRDRPVLNEEYRTRQSSRQPFPITVIVYGTGEVRVSDPVAWVRLDGIAWEVPWP